MKSWYQKTDFSHEMNNRMAAVLSRRNDGGEDGEVEAFLESLSLLEGLPLSYLAPDEKMLPPESLRVFWLDETWLSVYRSGAMSIGRNNRVDRIHDRYLSARAACDAGGSEKSSRMGFLIRSVLVTGWPGMEIECRDSQGNPLKILKLQTIADGVLLGIVQGTLTKIIFKEPQEALHYGEEDDQGTPRVSLVSMKSGKEGEDIHKDQELIFRDKEGDVVDVTGLAAAMEQTLQTADALDGSLSPAMFAAELIYKRQIVEWDITLEVEK